MIECQVQGEHLRNQSLFNVDRACGMWHVLYDYGEKLQIASYFDCGGAGMVDVESTLWMDMVDIRIFEIWWIGWTIWCGKINGSNQPQG